MLSIEPDAKQIETIPRRLLHPWRERKSCSNQPRRGGLTSLEQLQRTVANFFIDRQVIVARRAKRIEHACRQYRFHTMRNIAGEIEGIAGGKLVRHAINDESHLTFENVNNLLLRVSVLGHATPSRQGSDHLIHGLAVRDRTTCDARTNLYGRIFSFHFARLLVLHFIIHPSSLLAKLTREDESRECLLCCVIFA